MFKEAWPNCRAEENWCIVEKVYRDNNAEEEKIRFGRMV